jgi:thymidylate kinase
VSLTLTPTETVRPRPASAPRPAVLGLVVELADALAAYGIPAVQWKGHWKPERWGTGEGDIDLLVPVDAAADLTWVLRRLNFKEGIAPQGVPGMTSYFGLDRASGRLVHVHVHHRLLLGRMWASYYRLAIEQQVLASGRRNGFFRIPSPELELLLLALDQSLRRSQIDVLIGRGSARVAVAWPALRKLNEQANGETLDHIVAEHLPALEPALLARCVAALSPDTSAWRAFLANRALRKSLAPYEVRPARSLPWPRRGNGSGKLSATGGTVIALDGTDGSGKSTAAKALRTWIGSAFTTLHAHFGRPPRSLVTLATGLLLKVSRWIGVPGVDGHLELARCLATARDRFLLYRRVRRYAARGGVAICERYPNNGNRELAGPSTAQGVAAGIDTGLARWMRRLEARYYERIAAPDVLLVLCVDPETAVRRKTNEPEAYVRARAQLMARAAWDPRAQLIDAGRPFTEVLADLQRRVWEAL